MDAPHERILVLELGTLRAHEPQHHRPALGDEAKRLERAGSLVVVLQQEAVHVQAREELLRDRVVAALGVPMAAVVPAAQVHGQRDPGAASRREARVVGLDRLGQERPRLDPHLGFDPVAPLRVDEVAVARGVDLEIARPLLGHARELVFQDRDDVPQQLDLVLIDAVRDAVLPHDRRELRGARERQLDRARAVLLEERQLVAGQRPDRLQPCGDDAGDPAHPGGRAAPAYPGARQLVPHVEPGDGVGEVAHEVATAQLAVGEHVEADLLLLGQYAQHEPVFERPQVRLARGGGPRLEQLRGAQEAPDLVRSMACRHV